MRRVVVHIALMAGAALMLAGCGFADIRSPVPEFMRAKAPEPAPLEAPPDVKQMLKEKPDSVFTSSSHPTNVRVSEPRLTASGATWQAYNLMKLNVKSYDGSGRPNRAAVVGPAWVQFASLG